MRLSEKQNFSGKEPTKRKPSRSGALQRDIIRATALAWLNNHSKQLKTAFSDPDLAEIDKLYH
jgi:hypothetical protein